MLLSRVIFTLLLCGLMSCSTLYHPQTALPIDFTDSTKVEASANIGTASAGLQIQYNPFRRAWLQASFRGWYQDHGHLNHTTTVSVGTFENVSNDERTRLGLALQSGWSHYDWRDPISDSTTSLNIIQGNGLSVLGKLNLTRRTKRGALGLELRVGIIDHRVDYTNLDNLPFGPLSADRSRLLEFHLFKRLRASKRLSFDFSFAVILADGKYTDVMGSTVIGRAGLTYSLYR